MDFLEQIELKLLLPISKGKQGELPQFSALPGSQNLLLEKLLHPLRLLDVTSTLGVLIQLLNAAQLWLASKPQLAGRQFAGRSQESPAPIPFLPEPAMVRNTSVHSFTTPYPLLAPPLQPESPSHIAGLEL